MSTLEELQARQALLRDLRATGSADAIEKAERMQRLYHHDEMAGLAADAYRAAVEQGKPPIGWIRLSESPQHREEYAARLGLSEEAFMDYLKPDKSGFRAEIYLPNSAILGPGYQPVVAFKGSANSVKYSNGDIRPSGAEDFLANNFPQSVGLKTDYYDRAMTLAKTLNAANVTFDITGHSLGGGMASAAAAVSGQRTITFNAAGLHPMTAQRFARENGGIPVFDTQRSVTSYQVVDEMLNDSLQTALHKMQADNRDEVAGLLREMTDIASHSPVVRDMLKTALSEQLPPHSRGIAVEFVEKLSGPDAERLWREVPMAAGRVEPLLDAKRYQMPGDPSSGTVDRNDRPNITEMAYLAGPTMDVLRAATKGARYGEAVGKAAEHAANFAARQMDRSGDLTRRATDAGAEIVEQATVVTGALARHGATQAGDTLVVARKLAGEVDAAVDYAQGALQKHGADASAGFLRGIGGIDLLPDGLQRWANESAETMERTGQRAYERNLEEASLAWADARMDAQRIEAFTETREFQLDRIIVRASDLQSDAIRGAGEIADQGMDAAGAYARISSGQAKLGTTLAGAAAGGFVAQQASLSTLDPRDYPNIIRSLHFPAAAKSGGTEAFERHLMVTVEPSLDARVEVEEAKARALLPSLTGPKKSDSSEKPEAEQEEKRRVIEPPPSSPGPAMEPPLRAVDLLGRQEREKYEQSLIQAKRLELPPTETENFAMAMTYKATANASIKRIDDIVVTRGHAADGGDRVHLMFKPHGDRDPIFNDYVDLNAAKATPAGQNAEQVRNIALAKEQKAMEASIAQSQSNGLKMRIGGLKVVMDAGDGGNGGAGGGDG